MNNTNLQKTVEELFTERLKQLPADKLSEFVNKARGLGISETFITQGLKIINKIKNN